MKFKKAMARFLVGAVLLLSVGGYVAADDFKVNAPRDQGGRSAFPGYAGYKKTFKNTTAAATICTGSCLLAGVIMSTGAEGTWLRIRDSDGASGADAIPQLNFQSADSSAMYRNPIPYPLRFTTGITAELGSVAAGEEVTIIWLQLY